MKNTFDHIDELIGKHFAGEANDAERLVIENWLQQSEDNRRYFDHLKFIFDRAAAVRNVPQFDTDEAWKKLKNKIQKETPVVQLNSKEENTNSNSWFWKVAASIIFIIGLGFFAYRMLDPVEESAKLATEKRIETDTLPDGSEVVLNKKTTLAYSFDKKKKTINVKLNGEAYFNIQHDDNKRFIVEAGEVFIKDIGTSFNVKAYAEDQKIEVVVEEGEVIFYTKSDSGISLKAGGKGVYNRKTKEFYIEEPEPNVIAYKTKFFSFSDVDLGTVVQTLNSVYDKKLIIDKKLKNCRLNVSFNNEDIDTIASVIAETLGLQIKTSGQQIKLEGNACQ